MNVLQDIDYLSSRSESYIQRSKIWTTLKKIQIYKKGPSVQKRVKKCKTCNIHFKIKGNKLITQVKPVNIC